MKKIFAMLLVAVMMVSVFAVASMAAVELVPVDMEDSEAVAAATAAKEGRDAGITMPNIYRLTRLCMYELAVNDADRKIMLDAIEAFEDALDDTTLYTLDTYGALAGACEGAFQQIRANGRMTIHSGWMKDGWFKAMVGSWGGDNYLACNHTAMGASDLLEYTTMTETDKAAFCAVIDELVLNGDPTMAAIGWDIYARWMTATSDLDCRLIEQIYADMTGEGIDLETMTNNNPEAIENRKYHKNCTEEQFAASYVALSAEYTRLAGKYAALAPYAEAFAEYVEATYGDIDTPPAGGGETQNPPTADVAIVALAVSAVVSLAGAVASKKAR